MKRKVRSRSSSGAIPNLCTASRHRATGPQPSAGDRRQWRAGRPSAAYRYVRENALLRPETGQQKGPGRFPPKPLKILAPGAGFEPATNRLTVDCSTAELSGISGRRIPTPPRLCNPFRTSSNGIALPTIILRGAGCSGPQHVVIGGPSGPRCGALPRKASWRSGYAEDCKSLHPGSIPGEASKFSNQQ